MTDKVQKIREKVVMMHNLLPVMDGDNISVNYADRICTTLEMYIDSLQKEPSKFDAAIQEGDDVRYNEDLGCRVNLSQLKRVAKKEEPVSEDLEDEIGNYIENNFFGSETVGFFSNKTKEELNDKDVADIARHFAKWQKQKDVEVINENALLYGARLEGIEIGKAEMKQQIMAKAIDATCFGFQGAALFSFRLPAGSYLIGSKVKVIVINKD